jgi:hypothetical protein
MVAGEDGLACPLLLPGAMDVQIRGQGSLPDFVLSCRVRVVSGALLVRNSRPWMLVKVFIV